MSIKSKRMRAVIEQIPDQSSYGLEDAVDLLKKHATAKFDECIEIAINLGIDPRQSDQMVRGTVTLPNGTGKTIRVAVFAKDARADEARDAGADIVGAEDLANEIQKGQINFDRCIATPDMMAVVGKLGQILGPKGLMPNPKLGTVTPDVSGAVKAAKGGQIEFRAEKLGIVHAGVGRASFSKEELVQNVKTFIDAIKKAKPEGVKGTFMKKVSLASTMGPGLSVNFDGI